MAYQKLSPVTLIAAIQDKIEENTGIRCYDAVPENAESPFYFAEITRILPANTKTMFRDNYTVWIHCIAEESESSVGVYQLIEEVQEALTEDMVLPVRVDLVMQ